MQLGETYASNPIFHTVCDLNQHYQTVDAPNTLWWLLTTPQHAQQLTN